MNKIEKYTLLNDDPVIRTFTGKWINVFDPDPETIDIKDIAHSLSFQCRFGGQLPQFYSVAQHSIWCYQEAYKMNLKPKECLAALMHDASEAYLIDVPRPIKYKLNEYKVIEDSLMKTIAIIFNFDYPLSKDVKNIDEIALHTEWNFLMLGKSERIHIYSQEYAEQYFLDIFKNLTK
ncbi:MAG: metal-dependent phosphohydrolase [Clostridia bacterium]